jgi:hypothetical protein
MGLPFSRTEFLQVFAAYNAVVWPLQFVAAGLGLLAVVLLFWRPSWANRATAAVLCALWWTMAIGYHWAFFSAVNNAAYAFGALFLVAGLVFLVEGVVRALEAVATGGHSVAVERDRWQRRVSPGRSAGSRPHRRRDLVGRRILYPSGQDRGALNGALVSANPHCTEVYREVGNIVIAGEKRTPCHTN